MGRRGLPKPKTPTMRLKEKVAIVTGAASGIGRSTATLFAREGARLVLNDIDAQGLNEFVRTLQNEGVRMRLSRHLVVSMFW
jgi:3(or 17)beta-hydroxysteroid dehydrogenase